MAKRIIALLLCLITCVSLFAACGGSEEEDEKAIEDKGQYITMYLTENIYDLDPANAYYNEATRTIVGMMFETLFKLDEKGKVQKGLVDNYYVTEDETAGEYKMYLELKDTNWSDNTPISANDVVFAWQRILQVESSNEAAALLYDIKNARAVREGEVSIDDLGVYAEGTTLVSITFEKKIDYDQFILNLTSLALAPLREDIVNKSDDWAKKPATMVTSGPFKLSRIEFSEFRDKDGNIRLYEDINWDDKEKVQNRFGDTETVYFPATTVDTFREHVINSFILERNSYYFRNSEKDESIKKSVTPYRILVDCAMSDKDILEAYNNGTILYINDVPLSLRDDFADTAVVRDSLSTHTYYFNQDAVINGTKLFDIKAVRQALSMAIDREAIAEAVVYAEAATGIIPNGVFETSSAKTTFREACTAKYKYLTKNTSEAEKLLDKADINPSDYSFSITVATYDEVHNLIAEMIAESWEDLGFDVKIKNIGTVANNDYYKPTESVPEDICDDLYVERIKDKNFEVVALDLCALSVDPFSILAPFAKEFSGQALLMTDDGADMQTHITGYNSEKYNSLINKIFNEKDIKSRADDLRSAEAKLMEDMPAMPVIFNKSADVVSEQLELKKGFLFIKWYDSTSYYTINGFAKANVKDYEEYLVTCAEFLESKYEDYKSDRLSYFYEFEDFSFEEFKDESSNYSYLFPKEEQQDKEDSEDSEDSKDSED